jgi:hypothetical protein
MAEGYDGAPARFGHSWRNEARYELLGLTGKLREWRKRGERGPVIAGHGELQLRRGRPATVMTEPVKFALTFA